VSADDTNQTKARKNKNPVRSIPDLVTLTAYSDHVPGQDEDATDGLEPHVTAAIVDAFVYVIVLNLFLERS